MKKCIIILILIIVIIHINIFAKSNVLPLLPFATDILGSSTISLTNDGYIIRNQSLTAITDSNLIIKEQTAPYRTIDLGFSPNKKIDYRLLHDNFGNMMLLGEDDSLRFGVFGSNADNYWYINDMSNGNMNLQILDKYFKIIISFPLVENDVQKKYITFRDNVLIYSSDKEIICFDSVTKKSVIQKQETNYYWETHFYNDYVISNGWLINIVSMKSIRYFSGNFCFSDGKIFQWGSADKIINIFNLADGKYIKNIYIQSDLQIKCVSEKAIFGWSIKENSYVIREISTGKIIDRFQKQIKYPDLDVVSFDYDGHYLSFATGTTLKKYDMIKGTLIQDIPWSGKIDAKDVDGDLYIARCLGDVLEVKSNNAIYTTLLSSRETAPLWFPIVNGVLLLPTSSYSNLNGPTVVNNDNTVKLISQNLTGHHVIAHCVDEKGMITSLWSNGDVYNFDGYSFKYIWNFINFEDFDGFYYGLRGIVLTSNNDNICASINNTSILVDVNVRLELRLNYKAYIYKKNVYICEDNKVYTRNLNSDFKTEVCTGSYLGYDTSGIYFYDDNINVIYSHDGLNTKKCTAYLNYNKKTVRILSNMIFDANTCIDVQNEGEIVQNFADVYLWAGIHSCKSFTTLDAALITWAPCPSFSIRRKGNYSFEICMNRKDGLSLPLFGKACVVPWGENKKTPTAVRILKESMREIKTLKYSQSQIINFDDPSQSLSLNSSTSHFALVIESNGLLDTRSSDLASAEIENKPMFDGVPSSYDKQESIVITIWDVK